MFSKNLLPNLSVPTRVPALVSPVWCAVRRCPANLRLLLVIGKSYRYAVEWMSSLAGGQVPVGRGTHVELMPEIL